MTGSPRLHLAIDNCFASKRWTVPDEWMREVRALGLSCIEASADTEMDPLYLGREYLDRWVERVRRAGDERGARVVNLYSGHGTYATLGLAHTEPAVRERMLEHWLKPAIDTAQALGAGLGFFCHAFPQSVLHDAGRYRDQVGRLCDILASASRYNAAGAAPAIMGVEQMYTPHQYPWRLTDARELISQVSGRSDSPFYITIDVGHMGGQRRYLRPTADDIDRAVDALRAGAPPPDVWLGLEPPLDAAARTTRQTAIELLNAYIEGNPHLFATPPDGDPYTWLRELAGWSPIVHLQQTDGRSSAHLPFTEAENARGIISGEAVLTAIRDHYAGASDDPALPPRVADIYLTIEVFSSTAEKPAEIRNKLAASADYWRRFVPVDGMTADEALAQL